ncbi:hypothetical protein DPMN_078282 [Dreissena polymorpha]|uniref:Uncharacterized protein n=1 Tax=Dreissena polymorpha TaxID=45954 RepID=A0A9D3YNI6_DREPO|nr:hypothetical protein DPMN_078282 [Dreissena polymorpha]
MPAESRYSYGTSVNNGLCLDATGIHRGYAWALLATTAIKPRRCRSSAGVCCRYSPGDAGGVTVDRGSAGTLPGRCRLSPGLHLGITGDNRGSARASPG